MPLRPSLLGMLFLGTAPLFTLACSSSPQRQALSVSVSPATATAASNGQVQFTAAGMYNTSPTTVNPLAANWAVVDQSGQQTASVTVSSTGLAQCTSGASGVFTVGAWITEFAKPPSATCNVTSAFGNPCGDSVLGTAQLTCP